MHSKYQTHSTLSILSEKIFFCFVQGSNKNDYAKLKTIFDLPKRK